MLRRQESGHTWLQSQDIPQETAPEGLWEQRGHWDESWLLAGGTRLIHHQTEWPLVKHFQIRLKKRVFSKIGFDWLRYKHSHKAKGRSANINKTRAEASVWAGGAFQGRSPGPPEGPNLV